MRYCPPPAATPTILPAKLTTLDGEIPIRRISAQEYARSLGAETKVESWHNQMPLTHNSTPRSLYHEESSTWQPTTNGYRVTSHASVGQTTLAERLQSTSEVSRRLNSVGTMPATQEGQSLSESSGIIYCPEKASMDLTLAAHVTVPYPASVPRFQAPLYISPSLSAGYVSWETLMTQAEALERASEERELLERDEGNETQSPIEEGIALVGEDQGVGKEEAECGAPNTSRDQFPIPPCAVLDDS